MIILILTFRLALKKKLYKIIKYILFYFIVHSIKVFLIIFIEIITCI